MDGSEGLEPIDADGRLLQFPGRRIWKWFWFAGSAIVPLCILLSVIFSGGSVSDAPNHDYLLSVPILSGILLMCLGAPLFALTEYSGRRPTERHDGRPLWALALAVATVVLGAYLINPLASPVSFLHDSDLDSAQDYNDAYPQDHSRIDHPYFGFSIIQASASHIEGGWNVTMMVSGYCCWLDAMGIKILNSDNSTALDLTILENLDVATAGDGVRYFDLQRIGELDQGDFFHIDASAFADGSTLQFWADTDGWHLLQTLQL